MRDKKYVRYSSYSQEIDKLNKAIIYGLLSKNLISMVQIF